MYRVKITCPPKMCTAAYCQNDVISYKFCKQRICGNMGPACPKISDLKAVFLSVVYEGGCGWTTKFPWGWNYPYSKNGLFDNFETVNFIQIGEF